jgi:hypothetical protein
MTTCCSGGAEVVGMAKLAVPCVGFAIFTVMVFLSPIFTWSSMAHTPTALAAQNPLVCIGPGGSTSTDLYNAVGPADSDWTVRARIGLDAGGDTVQSAVFSFYMYDNSWSTSEPMANWGSPTDKYFYNPGYVHQSTLEIHAGGTMTLRNVIDNKDSVTQCWSVYARAFHSTD